MNRCLGCMEEIPENEKICSHCGYDQDLPAKEAYHISPGTVLSGRYLVGRVLGYGGFGVTYIGYDRQLNHKLALKEYLPGEFSTRMPGDLKITIYSGEKHEQFMSGKSKFLDEARRLAKFRNTEGIVEIYDVFELNDTSYIAMEFLDGETIKERLEREGKISPDQAIDLIIPVMDALIKVHAEGIIHRDISPDNIYILKNGTIKLLDFGAARYASTSFSKSLSVILKQGYAPEEQYRSRGAQGEWSDVYALAATVYKMITGITPDDAMERTVNDQLKPPSKLGTSISKSFENALLNALNVYREDRTQTVAQFKEELLSTGEVTRRQGRSKLTDVGGWKKWQKILIGGLGAAAVAVVVLFATGVIGGDEGTKFSDSDVTIDENQVYIPDILAMDVDSASDKINASSLVLQITDKQYSDTVAENMIMLQTPDSGVLVKKEQTIEAVVSAGVEKIEIGDYRGQQAEDVKKELEALGFTVKLTEQKSSLKNGTVISQAVEAGTLLVAGTEIELVVSKNDTNFDSGVKHTIGNYTGLLQDEIDSVEFSDKYVIELVYEFSDDVPENEIFRQEPEEGTELAEGSTITLYVSKGAEEITVPDMQYKKYIEAVAVLEEAGFVVELEYEASDIVVEGLVIRQTLEAGTRTEKGAEIKLYISSGPEEKEEEEKKTEAPTEKPTQKPTQAPTQAPTQKPTEAPTEKPTEKPTEPPTEAPTAAPTQAPTEQNIFVLDDGVILEISGTKLIVRGSGYLYDIPTGSTRLGSMNFTSVEVKYGITGIGDSAFSDVSISGPVTVASSVTQVGTRAFYGTNITSVVFQEGGSTRITIGGSAFAGCDYLEYVQLPFVYTEEEMDQWFGYRSFKSEDNPDGVEVR